MMKNERTFFIQGFGWVSTAGVGTSGSKPVFPANTGPFQFPDLKTIISELPGRIGRFDNYNKSCFTAAALALKDSGMLVRGAKENIGIIIGTRAGSADGDEQFYETTRDGDGAFSSPNIFSYTLPNVALGEIAVFFKLNGPTFCTGNDPDKPGGEALTSALSLLSAGYCNTALIGWVESAKNGESMKNFPKGAFIAVVSTEKNDQTKTQFKYEEWTDMSILMK
jgi:3-oxoacyl-(acyl-carrier-protein) synthase